MSALYLITISLIIVWVTHWIYRWYRPKCVGKLPPGSMGWPVIGETLEFCPPSDLDHFLKTRMIRYGPIFKTYLLGKPIVVSTDPDLSQLVLLKEGELFRSWYPVSLTEIFGRQSFSSVHGSTHKFLKSMAVSMFGLESCKKMLPDIQLSVSKELQRWSSLDSFELKDAIATMISNFTSRKLISYDPEKATESLRKNFVAFSEGLLLLPLNIPGTSYYKCLKGRKAIMTMLKKLLQERRMAPRKEDKDFFDIVIEELSMEGTILNEAMALDLVFVLLFASYETTSTAIALGMKFLANNPLVLNTLTEEHEAILRQQDNKDSGVTWKEYKSMTFTSKVINETLRLANVVSVVFRKALKDINFKGYTIPEGWGVMVCSSAVHLNSSTYENPLDFNPWRWKGEIHGGTKTFLAFGGGMRLCIGSDFAKVQMAMFLHCLVTKYRWESIKGGKTIRNPTSKILDDFHVRIFKRRTEDDVIKSE